MNQRCLHGIRPATGTNSRVTAPFRVTKIKEKHDDVTDSKVVGDQ